jgi:hypothetical protein
MSRLLTIISGAGILVLVSIPILFLGAYSEHVDDWEHFGVWGSLGLHHLVAARALFLALLVLGVTISGALALIVVRLADRHFRG